MKFVSIEVGILANTDDGDKACDMLFEIMKEVEKKFPNLIIGDEYIFKPTPDEE